MTRADGLIAVTPIFTTSYSGLFKSFFDVIDNTALTDMPVLIAATGGTARHSLALDYALRPLFTYLHAVVVPTAVFAASRGLGERARTRARTLPERIERAAGELADLVAAPTAPPRCATRSSSVTRSARSARTAASSLARDPDAGG